MKENIPFNYVNGNLILFVGEQQYIIGKEDERAKQIQSILNDKESTKDDLLKVLDKKNTVIGYIQEGGQGKVYIKDGEVYFNNEPLHNSIVDRILECKKFGLPFEHNLNFIENIEQNTSFRSKTELFDFLSNKNIPITPDGHFIAYKAVKSDWKDKYSGRFDNSIGKLVQMNRNKVDDNREHECSFGLHVGAIPYVQSYSNGTTDHIIYVKVNPKDVVSVPKDYNAQKVRVCEYLVLGEYQGDLNQSPVYNDQIESQGSYEQQPLAADDFDDDWDEDFYDDNDEDLGDDDDFPYDYYDYYDAWTPINDKKELENKDMDDNGVLAISPKNIDEYLQTEPDFGIKSNGQKYWNHRINGKFAKKVN